MIIENYKTKALHTFQIGTLNALGVTPRVTLVNKSQNRPAFATDYVVDVSIIDSNKEVTYLKNEGEIAQGARIFIDCAKYIKNRNEESIIIFHLIPVKYKDQEFVQTTRDELWALFTAQDHYVEFYNEDNFSSGVLYQSGAFNYEKFSKERSTIIQAPKCYFSKDIKTYVQLLYTSFQDGALKNGTLACTLVGQDGKVLKQWQETITPFSVNLLDLSTKLPGHFLETNSNEPKYACFYAYSLDTTLLPLTISQNKKAGTMAIEHSLPPTYYGDSIFGPVRKEILEHLPSLSIFKGDVHASN